MGLLDVGVNRSVPQSRHEARQDLDPGRLDHSRGSIQNSSPPAFSVTQFASGQLRSLNSCPDLLERSLPRRRSVISEG